MTEQLLGTALCSENFCYHSIFDMLCDDQRELQRANSINGLKFTVIIHGRHFNCWLSRRKHLDQFLFNLPSLQLTKGTTSR